MSNKSKVTVEASIAASVQNVWDAYNEPNHITQWNFAHESWHCPSSENDLREGGKFKNRMEAKDGSFGFDFEGTYDKVVHLKEINYTMADGRQAQIIFTSVDADNTNISIAFDTESENPVDLQRQGWQAILDNFGKYAASIK